MEKFNFRKKCSKALYLLINVVFIGVFKRLQMLTTENKQVITEYLFGFFTTLHRRNKTFDVADKNTKIIL